MKKTVAFFTTLLFSIVFALIYKWITTGNPIQPSTILFAFTIWILLLISLAISNKFNRLVSELPIEQLKKILLPGLIVFFLVILGISLIVMSLVSYLFNLIMGNDTTHFINHLFEVEFPASLKFFSVCVLGGSAFFFYNVWRQTINKEQQLREENLKYRYRTLKTQVNPHSLFNSLNTLSEMIYVDTGKADKYIRKLANVYCFILDHEETDLLPLKEELRFVKEYFSLQKERNGERIELNINIEEDISKIRIVPISLQILVENALKHNSASEENPLRIDISLMGDYIIMTNNIRKKSILNDSSGTGLLNLKERVKLIMNKELIICQEDNQFTVKLPVIKNSR